MRPRQASMDPGETRTGANKTGRGGRPRQFCRPCGIFQPAPACVVRRMFLVLWRRPPARLIIVRGANTAGPRRPVRFRRRSGSLRSPGREVRHVPAQALPVPRRCAGGGLPGLRRRHALSRPTPGAAGQLEGRPRRDAARPVRLLDQKPPRARGPHHRPRPGRWVHVPPAGGPLARLSVGPQSPPARVPSSATACTARPASSTDSSWPTARRA